MESIGGLKNKSTSSTIQSNAQYSGKLKIKSKIIDGVVAAVSIQANDNTTINQNLILPESSGSKTETLRIKNDVINNNQELEWYRVPEDSYSDLSYDRDVEFDIDVSNLSLNTGLSFDTDGGDFSNLINNKIGEDDNNYNAPQYVRFNVSSNPQIYPQSFTYTPDPTNDHSLRKVQMWIRKYGSGTETDKTMFPSKFEIYGIPRGGSSSDSVLITTINSPEVNNMNYSASTEYGLNNPVIDESFNPDGLIYDSYEFKIYGNRVATNEDNYYKPVIGEIKLFGRKVIRNFTNNSIYQLQGISKFETLNVKVVSSLESVNKGDVYKTDLNTSITASNYYTINDITTPNLKFRTGQIYIFNQDDSSNDGHPITFYTDRAKSTEYTNTDNIKYIINDTEYDTSSLYSNNFGNNRYRRVKILITDDMSGRLYYQCINHSNMGGVIETGTATLAGLADVSDTTPQTGDSLVYSGISNKWQPQRAASQFGLPAGDNAKIWWVAGESVTRIGSYAVTQTGSFDYSYDGDGHLYATNNSGLSSGTRFEINDANAVLHEDDRTFTMAIVIDIYDPNVNSIGLYRQESSESHWTYIYYNKLNHNHYPDSETGEPKWFSNNNISTGKQLIVLASKEHLTNSAIRTISLYINGSLIETTDSPAETYSGSTPDKVYIGGGNSNMRHLHNSKLYALATWERTLTTDEISQLTIDKLVSKRQTLPFYQISDNTPIDGQNLVYSSTTGQYEPSNLITVSNNPGDVVSYDNQASSSNWSIITGSLANGMTWASHHGGFYDNNTTNGTSPSYPERIFFVGNNSGAGISSSNFVEIEYTPTEPKIITRLLLWGRSSGGTGAFPKTVYIYGKNGTTYTELGTQTNSTAVVPGDTPTDNLAQIDFSFNSSKTFYEAYKLKITETVSGTVSVIIGELNFRGFNRETSISNLSNIGNVSTTAPSNGQAIVYDGIGSQWVPSLPVMPFFELFGLATSKTFSNNDYLTIVNSSGYTDANMSGTSFGINKYGTSVPTIYNSVELLQDAVYKIDYNISLNYTSDVRFVYIQFQGASSADGTYSTVRISVVNTYDNDFSGDVLDYAILSGSVLYPATSTNRFLKFYLMRNSTVKIHSNTDTDNNISTVYNSIIFQRIK